MPGIVLYNRRWALGSDDILLPAAVLAALHITWWERKPLFAETFPFREKKPAAQCFVSFLSGSWC